jgi:G:T-mismatch repair DNA endonuclease (very short patch repair protein)
MTPLQIFEQNIQNLNFEILNKHPNNLERRAYVRTIITDELLIYLYIEKKWSANEIASATKIAGMSHAGHVIDRIKKLGIETRDIKETCYLDSVRLRKTQTLLQKYGVINISQIPEVKIKKEKSCLSKYGVTNNFKSTEIKEKTKKYWLMNFGVEHPSELGMANQSGKLSKPHREVVKILTALGIEHETETNAYFKAMNPVLMKRYCPRVDIFVPKLNLVIEVFGTFWHATPKKYKSSDLFNTFYGPSTAQQIWDRDKIKLDHIRSLGYNIEVIWDDEISVEKVKATIKKYEDTKN